MLWKWSCQFIFRNAQYFKHRCSVSCNQFTVCLFECVFPSISQCHWFFWIAPMKSGLLASVSTPHQHQRHEIVWFSSQTSRILKQHLWYQSSQRKPQLGLYGSAAGPAHSFKQTDREKWQIQTTCLLFLWLLHIKTFSCMNTRACLDFPLLLIYRRRSTLWDDFLRLKILTHTHSAWVEYTGDRTMKLPMQP